jgi:hypothetical protein
MGLVGWQHSSNRMRRRVLRAQLMTFQKMGAVVDAVNRGEHPGFEQRPGVDDHDTE